MRSDGRFFDAVEKPPPAAARLSSAAPGSAMRLPFASSPRLDAPSVSLPQYPVAVPYPHPRAVDFAQQQQQHSYRYPPPPSQYSPQEHQQHYQQQQPLLPQFQPAAGSSFNVRVRPKPRRSPKTRVLTQMVKLAGFHVLNAVLGFSAFSLLSTGVGSSVSLLPLCCVGIIVFRIVLYGVHVLAELDVMLANFVSPAREKILLELPLDVGAASTGYILAPSLEQFSPMSLMALLYFLSVKFGVAVLSALSAAWSVFPIIAFLAVISGNARSLDFEAASVKFAYEDDSTGFLVAAACFCIIGCALMVAAAKVSTRTTKFFCSEPLARHALRAPSHQPLTVTANFSYGST
ncbi:hypothetical protein PybrP1_005609 [[Pythium] brassicae (nom. inval.)]|nr:hypothetical protein PybrP1_005609 [[Pythium] brassicae (nom. inval.)]